MIPLKLETLLAGRVVEQDRVEYKRGWNPSDTIHTICAFANDFTNTNGGYIVIGIEERNGRPVLPPVGVDENALDNIQKELFQYCNLIEPRYIPQPEIVQYQGKWIIYLWCSAGANRPYKAPKDVYSADKADKHREYWIKPLSIKTIAKDEELSELFDKFNAVPFDDRVNREAKITDIRRGYVEDFLMDSNSSLVEDLNERTLEDLLVALEVANATDVGIEIRNIGLLMFSEYPEKFLPGAQIELIRFNSPDAEASDDFTEKTFTGPLHKQIRDALAYIQATLIEEKVVKIANKAEAARYFNYPYNALEEAIVNAEFHKSYREQEPVEIRIYLDCIKIINYPGPAKWIDMEKFSAGKIIARRYRNRRIGEFLKEIDLSEKKSTGISKILRELNKNGSPPPEFETDDDRNYLITTFKVHEAFATNNALHAGKNGDDTNIGVTETDGDPNDPNHDPNGPETLASKIIKLVESDSKISHTMLSESLGVSNATIKREIKKLKDLGMIKRIGSTKGRWEIL